MTPAAKTAIDTRLYGADFMRAAACLIVFFHHLSQRMSWREDLGFMEWFKVFTQTGGFGVAIFFVLSGFLLARPFWRALDAGEPMPSLRTYALRRAARILPGFWLVLIVTFILSLTVFPARLDAELVGRFLAGFLLVSDWHWLTLFPVEINGPLWSIGFEVTSYVLLPLGLSLLFLARPAMGAGWQARFGWLLVIALALLAHWLFVELGPSSSRMRGWDYGMVGGAKTWMPRFNPFGFFAIFAIGALAAGVQVRLAGCRTWLFDALTVLGLALLLLALGLQTAARGTEAYGLLEVPYNYPAFPLIVGLILCTAPQSLLVGKLLDNPLTRYVAQISFGLYIWHYVVLELVRRYWAPDIDHGAMTDPVKFVVVSGIIVDLTVVIAHLSFHLLEAPAIRWARGRERPARMSPTLSPAAG